MNPVLSDLLNAPSPDQVSQVISHSIAPSFLLGAVAGFVSLLSSRLNGILDRIRDLNTLPENEHAMSHLRADLPRLRRRARLVNRAIFYAVISGVVATLLVIFSFISAFFGRQHVLGAGFLFLVALSLLAAALIILAVEVRIALNEFDEFDHHAVGLDPGSSDPRLR
ncbi:DUF2721 domain-containing protein [Neorhizobium sp. P12A]|jgi:hypothetical protein|uniref:DUF2721 domain-containing protein n=1 Tax=Rhizobium/Agrobacterium group TaxID=227290 RepID=UPI001051CD15|nr:MULTISPECIES: DUF2721 domain-containing protein [Rhizobium/Agrobacterium group]KAA0694380.1 DUF2721 domain-containing protein [Neorhizobium sp. P12A]TCR85488.1 uncharacterized protein DUF2721 [Rhizobium sp. BK376]